MFDAEVDIEKIMSDEIKASDSKEPSVNQVSKNMAQLNVFGQSIMLQNEPMDKIKIRNKLFNDPEVNKKIFELTFFKDGPVLLKSVTFIFKKNVHKRSS